MHLKFQKILSTCPQKKDVSIYIPSKNVKEYPFPIPINIADYLFLVFAYLMNF